VVCDEGSSLVRLFSQVSLSDLVKNSDGDEDYASDDDDLDEANPADDISSIQKTQIQTFDTVETELDELIIELNRIPYNKNLSSCSDRVNHKDLSEMADLNDDLIYDLNDHKLYIDLQINLGSNDIPRFSCACHKLNIIIHSAIENQGALKDIIKELGKLASKLRNSSQLLDILDEVKCRPKIEQKVRWFSQLYVLLWAQRAYKKNAFTENECPIRIEVIKSYIQILMPAYKLNLGFQSSFLSIADVIPGILRLKFIWERLEVDSLQKELIYFLLHHLRRKFDYELNCPIYEVTEEILLISEQNLLFTINFDVGCFNTQSVSR